MSADHACPCQHPRTMPLCFKRHRLEFIYPMKSTFLRPIAACESQNPHILQYEHIPFIVLVLTTAMRQSLVCAAYLSSSLAYGVWLRGYKTRDVWSYKTPVVDH